VPQQFLDFTVGERFPPESVSFQARRRSAERRLGVSGHGTTTPFAQVIAASLPIVGADVCSASPILPVSSR